MVKIEVVAKGTHQEWIAYYPHDCIMFFRKRELAEEYERLSTIMKMLHEEVEQIEEVKALRSKLNEVNTLSQRLMKRNLEFDKVVDE